MNNEPEHSDLDRLLKEKLGNYKETPSAGNWERFERNYSPRLISYRRFNRYRRAFYGGIAIAASLAILLLITNIKPEISKKQIGMVEPEPKSAVEQGTNELKGEPRLKALPKAKIQHQKTFFPEKNSSGSGNLTQETSGAGLVDKLQLATDSVKKEISGAVQLLASLSLLEPIKFTPFAGLPNDTLKFVRTPKPAKVSSEPARKSKVRSPNYFRKKGFKNTISPKKPFYPKHSYNRNFQARQANRQSAGPSLLNGFLSKLEYKINVTPQYCGQTLNNKGGVVASDFDPKFYRAIENGMFAFSGGLEVVYPIGRSWSIYSGLKWNEYKRETTNGFSQLKITNGQIAAPTSTGDVIIHGLVNSQLNSNMSFQTKLVLQSAEIPIIARFQAGKYVYLDGGLKYSYIFSGKTQTKLIGANLPFTYDQISDFKDQNLSLVFGAGFTFIIRSGLKFDAGPEICWNLTNLNPTSDLLNKPFVFGIRTSISLQRFERN